MFTQSQNAATGPAAGKTATISSAPSGEGNGAPAATSAVNAGGVDAAAAADDDQAGPSATVPSIFSGSIEVR